MNPALAEDEQWARSKWPNKKIRDARPVLAQLRMIKQPEEIQCIKQAIAITKAGLEAASKLIKPGVYEYELAAKIGQVFWNHNAGEAFPTIVAAGANACTIHYQTGTGTLRAGELVLFDVGAEYQNYAADISRTMLVSGRFDKRQR